jgi:hypothetical protein
VIEKIAALTGHSFEDLIIEENRVSVKGIMSQIVETQTGGSNTLNINEPKVDYTSTLANIESLINENKLLKQQIADKERIIQLLERENELLRNK